MKKFDKIPFEKIIAELLDESKPFPPVYLHRFSDLEPDQVKALKQAWPNINAQRRNNLIRDLDELAQAESVVMFTETASIALHDNEAQTRAAAIDLLTSLEDTTHAKELIKLLASDPNEMVREHAAIALGYYMYLIELEEISPILGKQVESVLLDTFQGEDVPIVRRRCMEALGYSSHKAVEGILEKAYYNDDVSWTASALFAMGRSAHSRWEKHILKALDRHESEILLEAARAAGELAISDAAPVLIKLVEAGSQQSGEDVFYAAIWAISQIGGNNARETLEKLEEQAEEQEDEEMLSFLDEALENLDFNEDLESELDFLDMDIEEMARGGRIIDLEGETSEDEEDHPNNGHQPTKNKPKKH